MPKYEVVIPTHGYERHIVEANSEEEAMEKAEFGVSNQHKWEYGIRDPRSNKWKVYSYEE